MRLWVFSDETIRAMLADVNQVVTDKDGDEAARKEAAEMQEKLIDELAKRNARFKLNEDGTFQWY